MRQYGRCSPENFPRPNICHDSRTRSSGVALEIDVASIPCVPDVTARAAASSGEEYELLVTMPDEFDGAAFSEEFDIPLTRIGTVVKGTAAEVIFLEGAERVDLAAGYDHFSA